MSVFRMAYGRVYGLIMQNYWLQSNELAADDNTVTEDNPLEGYLTGFPCLLVRQLQKHFNISTVLVRQPSPFPLVGSDVSNGSYDGMIGLVQRNEADMVLWPTFVDSGIKNITLSQPFGYLEFVMIQRLVTSVGKAHDFLIQLADAYDSIVWSLINVMFLTVALLVVCLGRKRRRKRAKRAQNSYTVEFVKWSSRFYLTLLNRSELKVMNKKQALAVGAILVGIFLFHVIGMSDLGTKLVVAKSNLYDSLEELWAAARGTVNLTWSENGYALTYFKSRQNAFQRKIYEKHSGSHLELKAQQFIDMMTPESTVVIDTKFTWIGMSRYVCHYTNSMSDKVLKWRTLSLAEMPPTPYAYVLNQQINSAIRKLFGDCLQMALEHGFMDMEDLSVRGIDINTDSNQPSQQLCFILDETTELRGISTDDIHFLNKCCMWSLVVTLIVLAIEQLFRLKNKHTRAIIPAKKPKCKLHQCWIHSL